MPDRSGGDALRRKIARAREIRAHLSDLRNAQLEIVERSRKLRLELAELEGGGDDERKFAESAESIEGTDLHCDVPANDGFRSGSRAFTYGDLRALTVDSTMNGAVQSSLERNPDDLLTLEEVELEFGLSKWQVWRRQRLHGLVPFGGPKSRRYRRGDVLEVERRLGRGER